MFLIILSLLCCFHGRTTGYCLVGDHENCAFRCHCAEKSECDTFDCPSGCENTDIAPNWGGPFCQIGNVAMHKDAHVKTGEKYSKVHPSSGAFDGKLHGWTYDDHCVELTNSAPLGAEIWADLGAVHKIFNVTLYNRRDCCKKSLQKFEITVYNTTDNQTICGNYSSVVDTEAVISCPEPLEGRYVRFRKYGGPTINKVTICEMVVVGYKIIDCSQCPAGVKCNDVTGCKVCNGSYQPDCQTDCEPGFYGQNCKEKCGTCKPGSTCDRLSGKCTSGCEIWWTGELCTKYIPMPEWEGNYTTVTERNIHNITILWKGVKKVSPEFVQYYGYNVKYAKTGSTYYHVGPDIPFNAKEDYIKTVILDLLPDTSYIIHVLVFREMKEIREHSLAELILTVKTRKEGISKIYLYLLGTAGIIIVSLVAIAVAEHQYLKKRIGRLLVQARTNTYYISGKG